LGLYGSSGQIYAPAALSEIPDATKKLCIPSNLLGIEAWLFIHSVR